MMEKGVWVKVFTLAKGDTFGIWRHGIISNIEEDKVVSIIHFCTSVDNPDGVREIRETAVEWFLENGKDAQVVDIEPKYPYPVVLERARRQLGRGDYDISSRNCQHFTSWCYTGTA